MSNYILHKGHDSTKFRHIITSILHERNILGCNFPHQDYFRQAIFGDPGPLSKTFTPQNCVLQQLQIYI